MEGIDATAHEAMLFAATGLLLGGLDDLAVDALYLWRKVRRRSADRLTLAVLPVPQRPGRLVVFVPAWGEEAVIAAMLTTALARYRHPDFRIHVGLYPNDPGTRAAAQAVADRDSRVRLVIGDRIGPTTKADCLNTLWRDLCRHGETVEGEAVKAVILHDAEDVVHPDELAVFDALIETHEVVQLPVVPLIDRGAIVGASYADDFAQAHANHMVVRTAMGAGMPLAGTGCAIAFPTLRGLAVASATGPFDPDSLVEDYELGLRLAGSGARSIFARVTDARGELIAVRAYFPDTLGAAVRQRSRWITGIALAGWDRIGWSRPLAIVENWFRARDRRAPLAMLVLAIAYGAALLWAAAAAIHAWRGTSAPPLPAPLAMLLLANTVLLGWRLVMRASFTAGLYGWRQGLLSVPRLLVGNVVGLLAGGRALVRYLRMIRGAPPHWDKTTHRFPVEAP